MTTPAPTTPPAGAAPATNVLAIIAIIAAIVIAPLGIILGVIARNQIKTTGEGGAGLAKAAIIVGIILTVLWLLFAVVLPLILVGVASTIPTY